MTHLSIDYIDNFDIEHFKEPIQVLLSNPICTVGLTYATCVTKDSIVLITVILF